ncbi:hypothetical protein K456DRAFT_27838 [Colletotrichum gloeosporioides 23]|nr:hypothetical protein K456DRAFT_27838 [Colletotrichum gloeosporioides 23]
MLTLLCSIPTLVGSFVVIASYAIGPFSQQASSTYPCDQVVGDAKLLAAAQVDVDFRSGRYRGYHLNPGYEIPPDMAAAVMTGMRHGETNISLSISNLFECKSGNCTFPTIAGITHTSIGICNTCTDITDAMEKSNREENGTDYFTTHEGSVPVTWPARTKEYRNHDSTGLSLTCIPDNTTYDAEWEAMMTITTFRANVCTDNTSSSGLIERQCDRKFGSISHTDGTRPGRDVSVLAANCSLHPCLRHYSSEVINGVLNEKLVSSEKILIDDEDDLDAKTTKPCVINGTWYFASNISQAPPAIESPRDVDGELPWVCTRYMSSRTISMIELFINETISGSCWYQWAGLRYQTTDGLRPGPVRPNEVLDLMKCDKWWLEPLYNDGNATLETISASLDIMATIMTNYMRATSGEYVNGSATSSFICIQADWLWLTYPGVLMILTAYLLMDEIIRCCRDHSKNPAWKSAILPLLFYNVEPKLGRTGPNVKANMGETLPLLDLTQLEKLADGMAVRFVKDRDSPGFVIEEKAEIGTEKKWSRSQEA